jgi:hypothetical protein
MSLVWTFFGSQSGNTALHRAVFSGKEGALAALLDAKADTEATNRVGVYVGSVFRIEFLSSYHVLSSNLLCFLLLIARSYCADSDDAIEKKIRPQVQPIGHAIFYELQNPF